MRVSLSLVKMEEHASKRLSHSNVCALLASAERLVKYPLSAVTKAILVSMVVAVRMLLGLLE